MALERKTVEVKYHFHHLITKVFVIVMIYH